MSLRRFLGYSDGELMRSDAKPCSRLMRHTAAIYSVGGALGFWVLCRLHYGLFCFLSLASFFFHMHVTQNANFESSVILYVLLVFNLCSLIPLPVCIHLNDQWLMLALIGSFARIGNTEITLLVHDAKRSSDIDPQEAQQTLD